MKNKRKKIRTQTLHDLFVMWNRRPIGWTEEDEVNLGSVNNPNTDLIKVKFMPIKEKDKGDLW